MWKFKNSINKIKNSMDSTTNKLDQAKETISGLKTRLSNYYIQIAIKKKISNHYHDFKDRTQLGDQIYESVV
jgi:peptidoglycan hydrolase CwlO-like protein